MSSVSLICIGVLLMAIVNGNSLQQQDAILTRNKRSLAKLNGMFSDITGHDGTEFLNYGNYCGFGGSGKAVDTLDSCCQSHDYCYNELMKTHCKHREGNAVYALNYEWKKDDLGEATCDKNADVCSASICICDVVLVNCLKANIQYYNSKNLHQMSFFELLQQGNYIANM